MKKGKRERMYQEEKRIDEERKKRKDVLGRKDNRWRGKRERMYQEEKRIDEERKKRKDVLGRKENR